MGHHSHSDNDKPQLAGIAILAAAVGALTALLLAPKSGAETRQEVRDRLASASTKENLKTRLNDAKTVASNEAKDVVDTLNDAVIIGKEQIQDAVKDAKRAARKTKEDNYDMTNHIRKNGEQ